MRTKPPSISEAERHSRWLERRRLGQDVQSIVAPPNDIQDNPVDEVIVGQFYLHISPYPHNTATVHKGQCYHRAKQKGETHGPFPTKEAASERALRYGKVRSVHLCKR